MVNARNETCGRQGCWSEPSFGVAGGRVREVCLQHAEEGIVNMKANTLTRIVEQSESATTSDPSKAWSPTPRTGTFKQTRLLNASHNDIKTEVDLSRDIASSGGVGRGDYGRADWTATEASVRASTKVQLDV